MIQSELRKVFIEHNGVLTTKAAEQAGFHDSTLRKAVLRKDIEKYASGIYFLNESYYDDLFFLQLRYPKGIYSHETAVLLHWLSTNYPFAYHISFPRGYHLVNAKKQNIQPHYRSEQELREEYIEEINSWDGNPLRVTNLEKTIVDMLRSNETTPGLLEEMIEDYLGRKEKNLGRLKQYGQRFKVEKLIEERILAIAQ